MKPSIFFGLKSKLFLALCSLALSVLAVASYIAVKDYEKDKLAQLYEANLNQNYATSLQVRSEILSQKNVINKIAKGYRVGKKLSKLGRHLFYKDQKLVQLWVFSRSSLGQYELVDKLEKKPVVSSQEYDLKGLVEKALVSEFSVGLLEGQKGNPWLYAERVSVRGKSPVVFVATVAEGDFLSLLGQSSHSTTHLIDKKGHDLLQGSKHRQSSFASIAKKAEASPLKTQSFDFNIDRNEHIVSVTKLALGDYQLVTLSSKEAALGPIRFVLLKMIVLSALLFFMTLLFSLFVSEGLTGNLKKIMQATQGVKQGDFHVVVDIKSKDEFGDLANSFNEMTGEIDRLLQETVEKTRMAGELETARMVQSNLFPELSYEDEDISINGYYQPASECGGDWWFHSHVGDKTYLWIGDATGHGASAALVTSAAKSAANVAQQKEGVEINEILSLMNNAIFETTNGKVNMTFLLACYDRKNHKFTYSRASHDPPFIMAAENKPISRKNIGILAETKGRRLGERPNSQYEIEEVDLKPGDRILFFTDGITEMYNPDKKMFGDRKLIKLLSKTFNEDHPIASANEILLSELEDFRDGEPLHDDVTYFFFERKAS